MNTIAFRLLVFLLSVLTFVSAGAQQHHPLNLDKDFFNQQYKDNGVKRVKKIYKSPAAQWTAEYAYDAGYLAGFENDSLLTEKLTHLRYAGQKIEIDYTPERNKAFLLRNSDTLDVLEFNEKKNLVYRSFKQPGNGNLHEMKYYYGDRDEINFISMRIKPLDKWMTVESFSHYYRDRKLRSTTTDTSHTMYLYDNEGRMAEEYDSVARKGWKKFEYDDKSRLAAVYEMRPGNRDFTFCPYFTQYTYDAKGRLIKKAYAIAAKNDKTGNCGYTLSNSVTYKYLRSGLLKKETGTGSQVYTIKYKYRK